VVSGCPLTPYEADGGRNPLLSDPLFLQVLKIIRYTAKLILATRLRDADPLASPAAAKLKRLEASIGDARKAYRVGKFLQGVQALRRVGWGPTAPLAVLAGVWCGVGRVKAVGEARVCRVPRPALPSTSSAAGDAAYYAIEQGTWLVRAGAVDARYARRLARASAAAELLSYAGSASLAALAAAAAADRERVLAFRLRAAMASRDERAARSLEGQLATAAAARRASEASLLQDACDALLAAADLGDGKGPIASSRGLLAAAGLVSALLGARKAWLK